MVYLMYSPNFKLYKAVFKGKNLYFMIQFVTSNFNFDHLKITLNN